MHAFLAIFTHFLVYILCPFITSVLDLAGQEVPTTGSIGHRTKHRVLNARKLCLGTTQEVVADMGDVLKEAIRRSLMDNLLEENRSSEGGGDCHGAVQGLR